MRVERVGRSWRVAVVAVVLGALVVALTTSSAQVARPAARSPEAAAVAAATKALTTHRAAIEGSAGEQYTVAGTSTGRDGSKHVRYDRTYHGLPVYGGDFIVHLTPDNAFSSVTISLGQQLTVDVKPTVAAAQARAAAVGRFTGKVERVGQPSLVVDAIVSPPQLAWDTVVTGTRSDRTPSQLHVLVDARTARYLESWDDIESYASPSPAGGGSGSAAAPRVGAQPQAVNAPQVAVASQGTGYGKYSGRVNLNDVYESSMLDYQMVDQASGNSTVCDMQNGKSTAGCQCPLATSYTDYTKCLVVHQPESSGNVWGNPNSAQVDANTAAVDVSYGVTETYDYFKNKLNRNGTDGTGHGVVALVHYDHGYQNALSQPTSNTVAFGDGVDDLTPYVSLDEVAHEISHVYSYYAIVGQGGPTGVGMGAIVGESGGLNEATSDIFASMVKFYAGNPVEPGDYIVGTDDLKRYLYDPGKDGHTQGCWQGPTDPHPTAITEIHDAAGVAEHFFYNLAEGTGTKMIGDSQVTSAPCVLASGESAPAVTGIGKDDAARIWMDALTGFFVSNEKYVNTADPNATNTARYATLQAATRDFGYCSPQYQAVQAAWTSVNVAGFDDPCTSTGAGNPNDVLFIHGYSGSSTKTATVPGGCTGTWDAAKSVFRRAGWTGNLRTVGFYAGDYSDGNSCDIQLDSHLNGSQHQDECDGYFYNVDTEGTNDQDLRNLSCQLAWYIYNTYTVNNRLVWVVTHSTGGLLIRDALDQVNRHNDAYPPALYVPGVVTFAAPNGGIPTSAAGIVCGGCTQLSNMEPGTWEEADFIKGLMAETVAPTGSPGEPTEWTDVTSAGDTWLSLGVEYSSALTFPDSLEGYPAVRKVKYTDTPGVSPNPYNHGGYLTDQSATKTATADMCDNCATPPDPGTSTWGALALALTQLLLDDAPPVPLYPVVNRLDGGAFFDAWQRFTGVYGPLGDPVSGVRDFLAGQQQDFDSGAIYWSANGTFGSYGPIYDEYTQLGGPQGTLGFPTTDPYSYQAGWRQDFENGSLVDNNGTVTVLSAWVVGHAAHAGDDYPYETIGQFEHQDEGTDAWNEYYGQCDSFAAWKVYENLAGSAVQRPASVPAAGWKPSNASVSPVDQLAWGPGDGRTGNADVWADKFKALGYKVDNQPAPGSIAWWSNAVPDPSDGHQPDPNSIPGSTTGHVGYVTDVYPDGSIRVEGYNMRVNGQYSVVYMKHGAGYVDNSFGLPDFAIPWPGGFIHVADGPQAGAASPPEPTDPGVVQAGYPASQLPGLTVAGPGDGRGDFTLAGSAYPGTTNGWYLDAGHGEVGQEMWTNTHKGAADSTATWSPSLTANTCYQVDAFVPDNWSNNAAALYTVTDQHFGTSLVPVDENSTTNDWVELGIFQAGSGGTLSVKLTDQGAADGQVAADAMRYIRQSSCSGVVRASQTVGYGSGLQLAGDAYPGTVNGWYASPGNGQTGQQYYTYSNGMTPGSSATWTATVLPNACYELFAYIPDNHANDYQALYTIGSGGTGHPTVSVNANGYTDAFAGLGTYRSSSTGGITVVLTDQSLASGDSYISADTLSFVHVACPASVQGAGYPALTVGPGSPLANFSLGSDWYNRFGHGDLGYEKWTNTHGSTAVSTATWTLTGLPANTNYSVCAFIPDNYANNTAAHYQGYAGTATSPTFDTHINQQATTNGWAYLGLLNSTSTGKVTVTLDDTGPTGTYTAADAIRLTTGSC